MQKLLLPPKQPRREPKPQKLCDTVQTELTFPQRFWAELLTSRSGDSPLAISRSAAVTRLAERLFSSAFQPSLKNIQKTQKRRTKRRDKKEEEKKKEIYIRSLSLSCAVSRVLRLLS